MNNLFFNLLSATVDNPYAGTVADVPEGLFDRFVYGLQFSAIGIIVVFIVLIILMLVIKVFELIFYRKNKTEPAETAPEAVPAAHVAAPVAPAASSDDAMMAAVIAAAVDAYYDNVQAQANVPVHARKKYQIRSFRRI